MIKKMLNVLLFVFLLALIACSEQTAGVTEEENPMAFEVKEPDSYDLWTFNNQISKNASGYWFDASDLDKELLATITYPVLEGKIMGDNLMDAAASMCGGICGTVEFADFPRSVLSTNIGYSVRKDGSTVDASSWKGLCVTYESDFDMRLKFSSSRSGDVASSDMPYAEFPKFAKLGTHIHERRHPGHDQAGHLGENGRDHRFLGLRAVCGHPHQALQQRHDGPSGLCRGGAPEPGDPRRR